MTSIRLKLILFVCLGIIIPLFVSLYFQNLLISTLVGVLSTIILSAFILLFLKPLKDLIQSAENLAFGNFNQRVDIRSGDEFEIAGQAFNIMASKISQTIQTLEKEKDLAIAQKSKLEEVLSSILDGIIVLDFNKNIVLTNKAALEITGYSKEQLQGQLDKLVHLFTDQEEIFPKTYCQKNFNSQVKLVGKDGKQSRVELITTKIGEALHSNLNCLLILHDLSKEEDLERMKLDFVSMVSHELKTPLTSIIGYLSVFEQENRGKIPKEEFDLVERSLIGAQQLLSLVQNILSVNKIEEGQLSVAIEEVDYLPILSNIVDELKNLASQKNILLTLNVPNQSLPKVLADPTRIEEVITNLLGNAINYTNPGGKVEISLNLSAAYLTTIVSDTGVGIPKEAIPHLFSKFFRVSNQTQRVSKGTGLGLYIAKSIVEKLNGKIWVESEAGVGSRFYFTLPISTLSYGIVDSKRFVGQEIQAGRLSY